MCWRRGHGNARPRPSKRAPGPCLLQRVRGAGWCVRLSFPALARLCSSGWNGICAFRVDTDRLLRSCFCPPSGLLQPGKPCSASVSAYIRTEQRLSPSLWSPFVSRRFIYGLKKLRVSVFVISVHTAEDGDDDGEGVQRAGGAFPDCHWRHEGNAKKTRLFHLILVVNICVTHIWCLRQGGCCRGFWSADPVAQNQRKAFRLCWRF